VIPTIDEIREGRTLAESQGFTAELGEAVAALAGREAEGGDLATAREILEGLLVTNPRDALAWALLSQVERRRGEPYAAVLCAEAAHRLTPEDRQVRLARAEALLAVPEDAGTCGPARRDTARCVLAELVEGGDDVARRASALLRAMG
jgi:predicted Zn-dependent protease